MFFLLRLSLWLAYCYHVYQSFSMPGQLQQLTWWLPLAGSIAYGSMIYFGKKIMANRAPLNPKNAMLIYNIYQSGINGFMAAWLVYWAYQNFAVSKDSPTLYSLTSWIWGNYEDHSAKGFNIAFGMWMHYNNKYLELFDTFFMVVKKKDEQISFLHVYHHILLVWSWFACISFCIGGDAYYGASFNSLVHFFMYGYYALALFQISCPWKKHLTMFQMIQFVCCGSQSIYVFFKGNVWWFVPALQLFVMINMLYLFSKFYSKKYNKKDGAVKKPTAVKAATSSSAEFSFDGSAARESPASSASPPPTFSTALVNNSEEEAVLTELAKASPKANGHSQVREAEEEETSSGKKSSSKKKASSSKKRSKKAE